MEILRTNRLLKNEVIEMADTIDEMQQDIKSLIINQ